MGNTRKAKWTKWQHIPNVKLWQAVALSLDIDPNAVKHNEMIIDESPFDEGEEFDDRLEILKSNYWDRKLFSANDLVVGKINECKVSLSEFAVWALSIPWKVPQELADLAQKQKTESDNVAKPGPQTFKKRMDIERENPTVLVFYSAMDALEKKNGESPTHSEVWAYLINEKVKTDLIVEYMVNDIDPTVIEKIILSDNKFITKEILARLYQRRIFDINDH